MKLPRDMSGDELARKLVKYGYRTTRQTGSHLRLTTNVKGHEHHVTIPAHNPLKIGTMNSILKDVASYLEITYQEFVEELFK